jgi:bacterial/archaeal transporter family protein
MILGVLMGLLCAASWAIGSVSIRNLARKLDPFTLNAPRTLAAGIVMLVMVLATGRTPLYATVTPYKLFFLVASIAISSVIGDALYVTGLARMGVSRTLPIANSYPVLTLVLGLIFLHEKFSLPIGIGLVLVFAGVILVSRRPESPAAAADQPRSGLPFAIAAAVFWAVGMITVAPGIEGLDALMASSIRMFALSFMLWLIVLIRRSFSQLKTLTRREWLILVVGGTIGWGFGNLFFVIAVALLGSTRAAILGSTPPLFALPLSVILLKEKPNVSVVIGTILAVLGIVFVSKVF